MSSTVLRPLTSAIAIFSLAFFGYVLLGDLDAVKFITSEDRLIENLTALAFAIGAMTAGAALWRRQHMLFAGLWLVLCVLFLGEETSWFQRVIGYNVPAIERMNSQSEFNFHNLEIIHGNANDRAFLSKDGKVRVGWHKLLSSQSLFRIGFFGYFLILPAILLIPMFRRWADRLAMPRYDWGILGVFWALIAITIVMTLTVEPARRLAVAETRELLYALTIATYVAGFALAARPVHGHKLRERRAFLRPDDGSFGETMMHRGP